MGKIGAFVAGAGLVVAGSVLGPIGLGIGALTLNSIALSIGWGLVASAFTSQVGNRQSVIERNTASPDAALPVVSGTMRLGLRIVDIRVDPNSDDNKHLWLVGAVCHGSSDGLGIQGIDQIYFDGKLAVDAAGVVQPFFSGKLAFWKYLGSDTQNVATNNGSGGTLNAKFPTEWPTTSAGRGVAALVFRLTFDPEVYGTGIPNVTAIVRGLRVLDVRTSTWTFSPNPALAIYDYLTSTRYGLKAPTSELHTASFQAEANYCDELVAIPGGSHERFEAHGWLDTGQSRRENLRLLGTSCRGAAVYEMGQFWLWIRKAQTATTFTLSPDTIVGDWSFRTPGVGDRANHVHVTYLSSATNDDYQPIPRQYPAPGDANPFLTADAGYEVVREIELPFATATTPYRAEQIAQTLLKESRDAIGAMVTAKEAAIQLQVGDVVPVSHETPGWTDKLFWVSALFLDPSTALVRLALMEYNASAYALDGLATYTPAPNTNLPNPFAVAAPTGLTLLSDTSTSVRLPDGTWQPRVRASWTAAADPYLDHYDVEARKQGAATWTAFGPAGRLDTQFFVAPLGAFGTWEVRLRAVNTLGRSSAWVSATVTGVGIATAVQEWVETFEEVPDWVPVAGAGTMQVLSGGETGGKFLRCTGHVWKAFPHNLPFDPSKLYRLRARFRQHQDPTNGQKFFYCGVEGVAADGVTLIDVAGGNNHGGQHYIAANALSVTQGATWTEVTGWFRGIDSAVAPLPAPNPLAPTPLFTGVKYIRPLFIANYNGGDGVQDIDYLALDVFDEEAQQRLYSAILSSGDLTSTTGQNDGATVRPLVKGRQIRMAHDGSSLPFEPPFQNIPDWQVRGGITYQPSAGAWSPTLDAAAVQQPDLRLVNVTASGATVYAKLRQPGTPTTHNHDFAGTTLDALGETDTITLSGLPASPGADPVSFTVRGRLTLEFRSKTGQIVTAGVIVAMDTNQDGAGWVERATVTYVSDTISTTLVTETYDFDQVVSVSNLDSDDQLRLRLKDATSSFGAIVTGNTKCVGNTGANNDGERGVTYQTSNDNLTTATPGNADLLTVVAEGFQ